MRDPGFPGDLLCEATAELISVAATIECLSDSFHPSVELLEAQRAIHNALVALSAWNRPLDFLAQVDAGDVSVGHLAGTTRP